MRKVLTALSPFFLTLSVKLIKSELDSVYGECGLVIFML